MNLSFEGKVALVTGAASGMGLATAQAFAQAGAAVALVDRNEAAVRKLADRMVAEGHKALAIPCDVTDEAQVKKMVEQVVSAFGHLDAGFNNAGVQSLAVETADSTSEEFDRVNAIKLRAHFRKNATHLFPADEQVVRPANVRDKPRNLANGVMSSHTCQQRQDRGSRRRQRGT